MSEMWNGFQQQRARQEQVRQNSGRLARHALTYTTHGYGDVLIPNPIRFDCLFISEPSVVTGFAVASPRIKAGEFPLVSAGVYDWDTDSNGMYRGAYIFMSIDTNKGASNKSPLYEIHHHFVFETIALKQLPDHVLNDVPDARRPGGLG